MLVIAGLAIGHWLLLSLVNITKLVHKYYTPQHFRLILWSINEAQLYSLNLTIYCYNTWYYGYNTTGGIQNK